MNSPAKSGVKLAELIDKLLGNGKKHWIIVVKFITVITYTVLLSFIRKKAAEQCLLSHGASVSPRSADIHVLLGFVPFVGLKEVYLI